jgi:excisionase family DNA binding protein
MTAIHSAGAPPVVLPALLDVDAVAGMLGCSTRHVRRLADAGRMPSPIKLGSLIRWRRADLDVWLEAGCKAVRSPCTAVRAGR